MGIRGESNTFVLVDEATELDPRLYAPDGDPWCRFGTGLQCLNGVACRNPNHKLYMSVTGETDGKDRD